VATQVLENGIFAVHDCDIQRLVERLVAHVVLLLGGRDFLGVFAILHFLVVLLLGLGELATQCCENVADLKNSLADGLGRTLRRGFECYCAEYVPAGSLDGVIGADIGSGLGRLVSGMLWDLGVVNSPAARLPSPSWLCALPWS
jgi:hypothetical protein